MKKHFKYVAAALCIFSVGVFGGCGSEPETTSEMDEIGDIGEVESANATCQDSSGSPTSYPGQQCTSACYNSVRNWLSQRIISVCWHTTSWHLPQCTLIQDQGPCDPTACTNLLNTANSIMDTFCNSGNMTTPQFQECAGGADEKAVCQAKCGRYTQYQCGGGIGAKQPDYNNCLNAC
jgi:hypothetical protein